MNSETDPQLQKEREMEKTQKKRERNYTRMNFTHFPASPSSPRAREIEIHLSKSSVITLSQTFSPVAHLPPGISPLPHLKSGLTLPQITHTFLSLSLAQRRKLLYINRLFNTQSQRKVIEGRN